MSIHETPRIVQIIPCPPGLLLHYEFGREEWTDRPLCLALVEHTNGHQAVEPIDITGARAQADDECMGLVWADDAVGRDGAA